MNTQNQQYSTLLKGKLERMADIRKLIVEFVKKKDRPAFRFCEGVFRIVTLVAITFCTDEVHCILFNSTYSEAKRFDNL
ncbi:hypothetical protein [uncultured Draconibacterium sp.]|uniref:hypothetical protein n=1 Tax=uncultured Draconibacterium sp. TaxID=1573823 RepID=UPI0029C64B7E|nr:hypothetical protein [uncultured Draconibacterium sp.]